MSDLNNLSPTQYHVLYSAMDNVLGKFNNYRLWIPLNPSKWSCQHVRICVLWMIDNFSFANLDPSVLYTYTGKELLNTGPLAVMNIVNDESFTIILWKLLEMQQIRHIHRPMLKDIEPIHRVILWVFILELLVDGEHDDVISWTNKSTYEFEIKDTKRFARLWGDMKNNPTTEFRNTMRSVRNYYEKNKMRHIRNLVYQFVNMRSLLMDNAMHPLIRRKLSSVLF